MIGTKGAAKKTEVGKLHDNFAKELSHRLKHGEQITIAGETKTVKPSAALLAVIRGFLKDNNVLCDEGHESRSVGELTKDLEEHNRLMAEEDDSPHFTN